MWLPSIRTFSSLMTVLLAVGFFSNVYLVWVTSRRQFPVRWETFRLFLRYSSIIDLSLCAAIVWIVLRSQLFFHVGDDVTLATECSNYGLGSVYYSSAIVIASGVVAAARQAIVLFTFDDEVTLFNENHLRTIKLLRDVAVVGVAGFVSCKLLNRFSPDFNISLCFITGGVTSRVIYVLLLPLIVNAILGVVVLAQPTDPITGWEQSQLTRVNMIDMPYKAKFADQSLLSSDVEREPAEVSDSRWKRFVIVRNVGLATWFVLTVTMAITGVLTSAIHIDTLAYLSGSFALTSAWSAFAVFKYWT